MGKGNREGGRGRERKRERGGGRQREENGGGENHINIHTILYTKVINFSR